MPTRSFTNSNTLRPGHCPSATHWHGVSQTWSPGRTAHLLHTAALMALSNTDTDTDSGVDFAALALAYGGRTGVPCAVPSKSPPCPHWHPSGPSHSDHCGGLCVVAPSLGCRHVGLQASPRGPRPVCPWLCKGDGPWAGHGPPGVDVPDARLPCPQRAGWAKWSGSTLTLFPGVQPAAATEGTCVPWCSWC